MTRYDRSVDGRISSWCWNPSRRTRWRCERRWGDLSAGWPERSAGTGSHRVSNASTRDENTVNANGGRRTADELRVLGIPPDRAGAYRSGRAAVCGRSGDMAAIRIMMLTGSHAWLSLTTPSDPRDDVQSLLDGSPARVPNDPS